MSRRILTLVALSAALMGCRRVIGIPDSSCDPAFDVGCACGPEQSQCECYCDTVLSACTGDNAVFGARDECLSTCATFQSSARLDGAIDCRLGYGAQANASTGEIRAGLCSAAGPTGRTEVPVLLSASVQCEQDSCAAYCVLMSESCRVDFLECEQDCQARRTADPAFDTGDYRPVAEGDTLDCRVYHAYRAALHLGRGHAMNVTKSCDEVTTLCVANQDAGAPAPAAPMDGGDGGPASAGPGPEPERVVASQGKAGLDGSAPKPPANTEGMVPETETGVSPEPKGPGKGDPSPLLPPLCSSKAEPQPSDGVACTETCTDPCGVHRLGARVCSCGVSGVFDCVACVFAADDALLEPPEGPFSDCLQEDEDLEDNEGGCTDGSRCQSTADDGRFCACRDDRWDCDAKPDTFQY